MDPKSSPAVARPTLLLLLALSALLPYVGTLGHDLTWDDHTIVEKNPATDPATPVIEALSSPYWPPPRISGLYRPVAILAYKLGRTLWGIDPLGFHVVNLFLHLFSTLALLGLLRKLWPGRELMCWTASFLFALHPIHTEAVAGIVGSAELWAALWGFLAVGLWVKSSKDPTWGGILLAWLAWLLALGSKESAAGWLLLAAGHRLGILPRLGSPSPRRRLLDLGGVAIFVLFVLWRSQLLGGLLGMSPPPTVDNPLVVMPLGERILAASGLWLDGLARILIPASFMPDASYAQTLPEASGADVVAFAVLVALLGLILWRGRRGEPWVWGLAAALATQSLTMNILFPIGTCYAERLLYTPSFGYLLTLAAVGVALVRVLRLPKWALILAVLAGLALGARTYVQAAVWASDETLFRYAAKTAPRSVKARTNFAVELWHNGDLEGSEREVREAIRWKPDYTPGLILSARLQHARGEMDGSLETIKAALEIDSRYADGWTFLGALRLEREEWNDALDAYGNARLVNPRDGEPLIGIASALAGAGRWEESVEAWERARQENPGRPEVLYPYGTALRKLGRDRDAEALWRAALDSGYRSPLLLNDLAWLILQLGGDLQEAESLSREAVSLEESETHTDTLLRILSARGKFGAADSLLRVAQRRGVGAERISEWMEVVEEARLKSRSPREEE